MPEIVNFVIKGVVVGRLLDLHGTVDSDVPLGNAAIAARARSFTFYGGVLEAAAQTRPRGVPPEACVGEPDRGAWRGAPAYLAGSPCAG